MPAPLHDVVQLPQCCRSLLVSVHLPLHMLRPAEQPPELLSLHVPLTHVWLAPHCFPQLPQLSWLLASATQPPAHAVVPPEQVDVHVPLLHTWPDPHTLPQRPQFFGSLASATHPPAHAALPLEQWVVQVPLLQTCPLLHERPQCPQLWTSVLRLAHLPWQFVVRAGQPQPFFAFWPFLCGSVMHDWPVGQHFPLQKARCFGQWPVAAATASVGLIVTTPTIATPPARSASRRDIPPARPRAIMSIALPPLGCLCRRRNISVGTLGLRVPRIGSYTS